MNWQKGAKLIPLTQGKFAIVDEEDYESASRFKWRARCSHGIWYALCTVYLGKLSGKQIQANLHLHRLIMRPPNNMLVDHKDHNGLDCRKRNLRICDRSQNQQNQRPQKNRSSVFKGVFWCKTYRKWRSETKLHGKRIFNGYFKSEIDAARAYDRTVIEIFRDFAYTNFPRKDYENEMEPKLQTIA